MTASSGEAIQVFSRSDCQKSDAVAAFLAAFRANRVPGGHVVAPAGNRQCQGLCPVTPQVQFTIVASVAFGSCARAVGQR
jgi:hypothetical protein